MSELDILRLKIQIARARQQSQAGMGTAERAAAAKAGELQVDPANAAVAAEMDQKASDAAVLAGTGPVGRATLKVQQGIPFVGEYMDEAHGAVLGPGATEYIRSVNDAMDRTYPKTSTALRVVGGVVGSLPAAALGPAVAANAPAGLGAQAALGAGVGTALGGAEGAISGYGAGTDPESRAANAKSGGIAGAAFGGVAGAAAPMLTAAGREILTRMRGKDTAIIATTLGISKEAATVVKRALDADDLTEAAVQLRRAGADAMLADAGPGSAQLLDTAMQSGGAATKIGRAAVEARAARANKHLSVVMDGVLGKPTGIKAASSDISMRTASVRRAAYDRAYSTPIDYSADAGRSIEATLARVPSGTLKKAVQDANEAMQEAGISNKQILIEIADDGAATFKEMPNAQQIDYIKRGLQAVARNETDPITGRISDAGMRAKRLAKDLSGALGDAVPSYKTAVKIGGDKIAEQDALDMGRRLLLSGTTREQVSEIMDGASKEAKDAARQGLRGYLDDTLANVQRTITDPNVDAREAMSAIKSLSSRANREKVEMVLGKQRANTLFDALDESAKHLELRGAVARNSATAVRQAGQKAIDDVIEPGAAGAVMRGEPLQGTKRVVQFLTNRTPGYDAMRRQSILAEIAQGLTGLRGPQAEAALKTVQGAMSGQPIKDAEAAAIARLLGPYAVLGADRTGTQRLSTQRRALP